LSKYEGLVGSRLAKVRAYLKMTHTHEKERNYISFFFRKKNFVFIILSGGKKQEVG